MEQVGVGIAGAVEEAVDIRLVPDLPHRHVVDERLHEGGHGGVRPLLMVGRVGPVRAARVGVQISDHAETTLAGLGHDILGLGQGPVLQVHAEPLGSAGGEFVHVANPVGGAQLAVAVAVGEAHDSRLVVARITGGTDVA